VIIAVGTGLALPGYTLIVDEAGAADLYATLVNKVSAATLPPKGEGLRGRHWNCQATQSSQQAQPTCLQQFQNIVGVRVTLTGVGFGTCRSRGVCVCGGGGVVDQRPTLVRGGGVFGTRLAPAGSHFGRSGCSRSVRCVAEPSHMITHHKWSHSLPGDTVWVEGMVGMPTERLKNNVSEMCCGSQHAAACCADSSLHPILSQGVLPH
jgi:hypothetical protein